VGDESNARAGVGGAAAELLLLCALFLLHPIAQQGEILLDCGHNGAALSAAATAFYAAAAVAAASDANIDLTCLRLQRRHRVHRSHWQCHHAATITGVIAAALAPPACSSSIALGSKLVSNNRNCSPRSQLLVQL
jgi:hypothetical protein